MTKPQDDPNEVADNGVLDGGASVNTADLNLLGTPTSHVNIVFGADEDDDELVEDDFGDDAVPAPDFSAERAVYGQSEPFSDPGAFSDAGPFSDAEPFAEPERYVDSERHAEPEPTSVPEPFEPEPVADAAPVVENLPEPGPEPEPELGADDEFDLDEYDEPEPELEPEPEPVSAIEPAPAFAATALVSRRLGEVTEASVRETPDLLTADRLVEPGRVARPEPEGAWAHFLYALSGGRVNIGDGKRARARKALDGRISAPLSGGAQFVAVISRKGGVGKTTVTTLLGMALASAREDRVIAVDANPDRGTLSDRIARSSGRTVRDLVRERESLRGYNDVSAIVARDETRLDVLASDADPHVSVAFSAEEYQAVAEVAGHYYSIVLTDTGTGIVHSVAGATLDAADQLVVVAGQSIDSARLASETLTWLETNGYGDQVRGALVVINASSPGAPIVRLDELEAHFRSRVRDVVRIPYDSQLATGGAIVFRDLQPATREAARTLAAKVVEGLRAGSLAA